MAKKTKISVIRTKRAYAKDSRPGIHLLNPTAGEKMDARQRARSKGYRVVYIHSHFEALMNEQRADWAELAVKAFQSKTGSDDSDALADLLCDMLHYCDRYGIDFNDDLGRARSHYYAEIKEDGGHCKRIH
jgi:hypothetical protein